MTQKGFIYLASPYSHKDHVVMEERFRAVEAATAELLRNEQRVYSPIVHCHELAKRHRLPTTAKYWEAYNFAMLARAAKLYVLTIPGWDESIGVTGEMKFAHDLGLPVILHPMPAVR